MESGWSDPVQLNVDLRVQVKTDTDIAAPEGTEIKVQAADGRQHHGKVDNGLIIIQYMASGPDRAV